jgi:hypothetical protein
MSSAPKSLAEQLEIVRYADEHKSDKAAAARFGIPNPRTISSWRRRHKKRAEGIDEADHLAKLPAASMPLADWEKHRQAALRRYQVEIAKGSTRSARDCMVCAGIAATKQRELRADPMADFEKAYAERKAQEMVGVEARARAALEQLRERDRTNPRSYEHLRTRNDELEAENVELRRQLVAARAAPVQRAIEAPPEDRPKPGPSVVEVVVSEGVEVVRMPAAAAAPSWWPRQTVQDRIGGLP